MKYPFVVWLLLIVSASQQSNAWQQVTDSTIEIQEAARLRLAEIHDESDFPGGSFAMVLPDGRLATATVGFASVEDRKSMKPSDRMMSASIGKTYFAAMAMDLVRQGKLDLDGQVDKYLSSEPWFDRIPNAKKLKIKHLLGHQSGIPRYILVREVWNDVLDDPDLVWKPGDQLKYIYDRGPLHPPGKGWAYSDTNYILLGLILEKVSSTDVYEYVTKHFLKPNELNDTIPNNGRELDGLVQGYTRSFKAFGFPDRMIDNGMFVFNPAMEWCGGGFASTSADLARWAKILFSGSAMEGDYLKIMTATPADASALLGPGARYGLGVIIRETELGPALGHDGGFPGYSSTTAYFPQHQISAAFMYNTDGRTALPDRRPYQVMIELVQIAVQKLNER